MKNREDIIKSKREVGFELTKGFRKKARDE